MNRQCLICDSSAVLTRDAAKGLTLLIGLFNGAIEGAQRPHERSGLTPAEARHQTLHKLQHQRTVT